MTVRLRTIGHDNSNDNTKMNRRFVDIWKRIKCNFKQWHKSQANNRRFRCNFLVLNHVSTTERKKQKIVNKKLGTATIWKLMVNLCAWFSGIVVLAYLTDWGSFSLHIRATYCLSFVLSKSKICNILSNNGKVCFYCFIDDKGWLIRPSRR